MILLLGIPFIKGGILRLIQCTYVATLAARHSGSVVKVNGHMYVW